MGIFPFAAGFVPPPFVCVSHTKGTMQQQVFFIFGKRHPSHNGCTDADGCWLFYLPIGWQNNNLEHALDWIFSHPEPEEENETTSETMDLENHVNANILAESDPEGPRIKDGSGRKFPIDTLL